MNEFAARNTGSLFREPFQPQLQCYYKGINGERKTLGSILGMPLEPEAG